MSKESVTEKINIIMLASLTNESKFVGNVEIFKQVLTLLKAEDRQLQEQGLKQLKEIIDPTIDKNFLRQCTELIILLIINNNFGEYTINTLEINALAIHILAGITEILPNVISQSLDYFKDISDDKEASEYLVEAAANAIPEIMKAIPTDASEAFEIIKALADKQGVFWLTKPAQDVIPKILAAMPASGAFKTVEAILADEEIGFGLSYAATKAIPEIFETMSVSEVFENIKTILADKEVNYYFKEKAIEAALKKINSMPSSEAFEFYKAVLTDDNPDDFLKGVAINAIPQIFKAMSVIEATKAVKTILDEDNEASSVLKEVAIEFSSNNSAVDVEASGEKSCLDDCSLQ